MNRSNTTIKQPWTRLPSAVALVFILAFCGLAWDIDKDGIAAPYSDAVAKIRAQDEILYVGAAIHMTKEGDWPTPKVMGRLFYQKPPLLMWMTAASLKMFGWNLFAVRLPALLLGSIGIAAVFWWVSHWAGAGGGLFAAAMLFLSPQWQTVSRLNYTDVLASGFGALAMLTVALDPKLLRKWSCVVFGAACAAAFLSKSVAGLLPAVALGLYWIVTKREDRPRWGSLFLAGGTFVALAVPWPIYQLLVHRQWFLADFVQQQLLGVGMNNINNGVFDRPATFWLERMWQLDPVLSVVSVVALVTTFTRKNSGALLAWCWMLVVCAGLVAFQAKNLPYLALLLPPLCVLAGFAMSKLEARSQNLALVAVVVLSFAKMWFADGTRAIRFEAPPIDSVRGIRTYYSFGRETELFVMDPDDEFWSSTIPLPRVRYGFVDPTEEIPKYVPFYATMGVILKTDQLLTLDPAPYLAKFREMNADGTKAIGTTILLDSPKDVERIAAARPRADFSLPATWITSIEIPPTHDVRALSRDRVFLFSRQVLSTQKTEIELPQRW